MKKMITVVCLLSVVSAAQAADYKKVKDLMQDFLNLKKKQDAPLSYWLEELTAIIKHEKKFSPFISELSKAKENPDKLLKAFKKHSEHFDNGVKVHLLKTGKAAIEKAFTARTQTGKRQDLTPSEKMVVVTAKVQAMSTPEKVPAKLTPNEEVPPVGAQAQVNIAPVAPKVTHREKVTNVTAQPQVNSTLKRETAEKKQAFTPCKEVTSTPSESSPRITTEKIQTLTPGQKVAVFAMATQDDVSEPQETMSWYHSFLTKIKEGWLRFLPFQINLTSWWSA